MGSKQTTTSNQETGPWKPAQGALQGIMNKAKTLGNNTDLFAPVQGDYTRMALEQAANVGNQGSSAFAPINSVVSGSTQGFQTGMGALSDTASGANLGRVNPYLQQALDTASGKTANLVNQQFAGAGRYGSANHAGVIADRVGAIQTQGLMDNYNAERQAQLQAASQLNSGGYQGAALAPQLDQSRMFGSTVLGQVGAQQDAYNQAVKQAPLNALQWQAGQINPIAAMGSQGTSTQTQKTSNPVGTAIGIGSTLAGMAMGGPAGMGAMAGGGGGLFSMFGGGGGWAAPTGFGGAGNAALLNGWR